MKVVDRDPKFVKPYWIIGKAFRCVTCDRDYIFESSDIEEMEPFINGKKCGSIRLSNQGRTVDFNCCGCDRKATINYYDFYSRNW